MTAVHARPQACLHDLSVGVGDETSLALADAAEDTVVPTIRVKPEGVHTGLRQGAGNAVAS